MPVGSVTAGGPAVRGSTTPRVVPPAASKTPATAAMTRTRPRRRVPRGSSSLCLRRRSLSRTGPTFRFVAKLPRLLTHERRLGDVDAPLREFLDAVAPLGPRLHALWIQLPGSFTPADVPVLERFLRRRPDGYRWAVEVLHLAFFTDPAAARRRWRPPGPSGCRSTRRRSRPPTSAAERKAWGARPRVPVRTRALTDRPIVR